ncbi:MAG: S8 family serine peptidase, partial [Salibacteraceae bacterium]
MKHISLILIYLFLQDGVSVAQKRTPAKLPLSFEMARQMHAEAEYAHLFAKGDESKIKAFISENGGSYKYRFHNYHALYMPVDQVETLSQQSFVSHVHFELSKGEALLNESLIQTNTKEVHAGDQGLPDQFKGEGVIMGIIDAGIELQHPDFKHADGSTRIIELWDQTMAYDPLLTPAYGYGQVWDSTSINAQNCPHQDQIQFFGHGTNVAGIAAGNGLSNDDFIGHAPESELIVVSSNFSAIGWTNTVADAVDYIFARAEALGKPCVINASIGSYLGSHDAKDIASLAIEDDITEQHGRIMVCAAGNSGSQDPYHLGYEADSDTTFTWFKAQPNATIGDGLIFFEMFGDSNDFERLQFSIGADQVVGNYAHRGQLGFDSVLNRLNIYYEDTLWSFNGNFLARFRTYGELVNGVYR